MNKILSSMPGAESSYVLISRQRSALPPTHSKASSRVRMCSPLKDFLRHIPISSFFNCTNVLLLTVLLRPAVHLIAQSYRRVLDLADHAHTFFRRTHHSAFAYFAFADFKLRFDERDDFVNRCQQCFYARQNQGKRDKGNIDSCQLRSIRQAPFVEVTDISFLKE